MIALLQSPGFFHSVTALLKFSHKTALLFQLITQLFKEDIYLENGYYSNFEMG
jgi:hypothetical protein